MPEAIRRKLIEVAAAEGNQPRGGSREADPAWAPVHPAPVVGAPPARRLPRGAVRATRGRPDGPTEGGSPPSRTCSLVATPGGWRPEAPVHDGWASRWAML